MSARADYRKVMNAIFYVLRTGMPLRFAGTILAVHDGVQSLQSLVSTRHLEADFRHVGIEIARQTVSDRHDSEIPPTVMPLSVAIEISSKPRSWSFAIASGSPDSTVLNGSTYARAGFALTTSGTRSKQ
jgi:hypothetical protein